MQQLLQMLLADGLLQEWEDTDFDLPFLLRAVALIRHGALTAGLGDLRRVAKWQTRHLKLIKACLGEDLILNAFAEDYHNAFPWEKEKSLDLLWGALLGNKIEQVYSYYNQSTAFYTRVAGLKHSCLSEQQISKLTPEMSVIVMPEWNNPVDPNAIAVLSPNGTKIGYLRKTLAGIIASRLTVGVQVIAEIAHVLPEGFDPNSRVNIKVKLGSDCSKPTKVTKMAMLTVQIIERRLA
ncbi:MAG: hypothetical protein GX489_03695 [Firmicutes bacterium]|nr:hypothetical protein [Bacillota bacterium]